MALSRDKKQQIVSELTELLANSKMTVIAKYEGITVKQIQELRRDAETNHSVVKVVKNRLVRKAIEANHSLKDADSSALTSMLLYVFNADDEVAGAQTIKSFVKNSKAPLEFAGAISAEGAFLSAEEVKTLAELPSKEQLIAGVINTLKSPATNVVSALKGNLLGLLDAVAAKAS